MAIARVVLAAAVLSLTAANAAFAAATMHVRSCQDHAREKAELELGRSKVKPVRGHRSTAFWDRKIAHEEAMLKKKDCDQCLAWIEALKIHTGPFSAKGALQQKIDEKNRTTAPCTAYTRGG